MGKRSSESIFKLCSKCKTIADFSPAGRWCRECSRVSQKAWYEKNRAKHLVKLREYHKKNRVKAVERAAAWAHANPDRYRANQARYYEENKESLKQKVQEWRVANPERRKLQSHKRRKQMECDNPLTIEEWTDILNTQEGHCFYCNQERPLVLEHMTPLSRGGLHTASNVVGACQPCNNRKYTKTAEEFLNFLNEAQELNALAQKAED